MPVDTDDNQERDIAEEETTESIQGDAQVGVEGANDEDEEEFEKQRFARNPELPSREMLEEHKRTHIPFRPWCRACVRGKGKKRPSLNIKGAYAEGLVARVRMDYAFLNEKIDPDVESNGEVEAEDALSQTMLVMQESQCTSVWSYAVEHKGSSEEWVVHQIC